MATAASAKAVASQPLMVIVELAGSGWVFPVDAVHGVERFDESDAFQVPATSLHDTSSLIRKVLKWDERRVGLLDIERAISSLDKNLR